MTTESLSAAPGWYPDGFGATRFFDGAAWTDHTQPAAAPAPPPAPAAPPVQAAATAPAAGRAVRPEPFYRQGWFVVDVLFLAGIALVILYAAAT